MATSSTGPFGLTNPQGQVFATVAAAAGLRLPVGATKITIADMEYEPSGAEPTHDLKVQTGDGRWWEVKGPFYPVARIMTAHAMDATQAFVAAGAVVDAKGFGEVFFDKAAGDYHVADSSGLGPSAIGGRHVLRLYSEGVDIRITGNGAVISLDADDVDEYAYIVRARDIGKSSRIHVDGITFRYTNKPYVTGRITAVSAGSYVEIEADFHPTFDYVKVGHRYEGTNLAFTFAYDSPIATNSGLPIAQHSGMLYRIDITGAEVTIPPGAIPAVGTDVVFIHRKYDAHIFAFTNIGDLYIGPGVTIEEAAGMGVFVNGAGHVHIDGAQIVPNAANRLPYTVPADGWHITSTLSTRIIGTTITATGDDNMAVAGGAFSIVSRDSDTQVTFTRAYQTAFAVNDFVQIVDATRALDIEARIVSIDAESSTEYTVTLDTEMGAGVDDTYQLFLPTISAVVSNNILSNTTFRGMIAFARTLHIADNTIFNTGGPGIYVYSDNDEATYIDSFTVKDNILNEVNSVNTWSGGILVKSVTEASGLTTAAAFRHGDISGNTIDGCDLAGISVYSTGTVSVRNNTMNNIARVPTAVDGFTAPAVALYGVGEAIVDGNSVNGDTVRRIECITVAMLRMGNNIGIRQSTTLLPTRIETTPLPVLAAAALATTQTPDQGAFAYGSAVEGLMFSDATGWRDVPSFRGVVVSTDADFTRTIWTNQPVVMHTGVLTANRTCTLATTNAYDGAMFYVGRTGTGEFTLSVNGLVSLWPGQWAWLRYNSTAVAWELFQAGSFRNEMQAMRSLTVASAATVDLGAIDAVRITISGTTTITSFGTGINKLRYVIFGGALTLTHNGTSLILPGAANIPTALGDTATFISGPTGNWRCQSYMRAAVAP